MQTTPDKVDYLLMVPSCCGGPTGRGAMMAFRAAPGRPPASQDGKGESTDRKPRPAEPPRAAGDSP